MFVTSNRFVCYQAAGCLLWVVLALVLRPDAVFWAVALPVMVWCVTAAVYSRCSRQWPTGWYLLLGVTVALGCGVIINAWYFTTFSGGTDHWPAMVNYDALRNWSIIRRLSREGWQAYEHSRFIGYPTLLWWLCSVTGQSLLVVLTTNMLSVLLTIILTGKIAVAALSATDLRPRSVMTLGMAVACCNCYFLITGTLVLKDALIQLVVAAFIYLCIKVYQCSSLKPGYWLGAVALLMITVFVRDYLIPPLIVGLIVMLRVSPTKLSWSLTMVIVAAGLLWLSMYAAGFSPVVHSDLTDLGHSAISDSPGNSEEVVRRGPLTALLRADYFTMPLWKRLAVLPLTSLCQFLIPFPWNFMRDTVYGPTQFVAHIAYPAYLVGIVLCFGVVFCLRRTPRIVLRLLLWGTVAYCGTALITGGTISRYCLMYTPLAVPLVVYTLAVSWRCKRFRYWVGACSAAMAAVLIVCHHLAT